MRTCTRVILSLAAAVLFVGCAPTTQEIRPDYKGKTYPNETLLVLRADSTHLATLDTMGFMATFPGIQFSIVAQAPKPKPDSTKAAQAPASPFARPNMSGTTMGFMSSSSMSSSSMTISIPTMSSSSSVLDSTPPAPSMDLRPRNAIVNDRSVLSALFDSSMSKIAHGTKWVLDSVLTGGEPLSKLSGDKVTKVKEYVDDKAFNGAIPTNPKSDARFVLVPLDVVFTRDDPSSDSFITSIDDLKASDTAKANDSGSVHIYCMINYMVYDYQARQAVALGRADGSHQVSRPPLKSDWSQAAEAAIQNIFARTPFQPQAPSAPQASPPAGQSAPPANP